MNAHWYKDSSPVKWPTGAGTVAQLSCAWNRGDWLPNKPKSIPHHRRAGMRRLCWCAGFRFCQTDVSSLVLSVQRTLLLRVLFISLETTLQTLNVVTHECGYFYIRKCFFAFEPFVHMQMQFWALRPNFLEKCFQSKDWTGKLGFLAWNFRSYTITPWSDWGLKVV